MEVKEVILCQECKYFSPYRDNKYSRGDCMNYNGMCVSVSPQDYCSKGVKKDNE